MTDDRITGTVTTTLANPSSSALGDVGLSLDLTVISGLRPDTTYHVQLQCTTFASPTSKHAWGSWIARSPP